jgi:hypothetical protein
MRTKCRLSMCFSAMVLISAAAAAQDSTSLGDLARQQRQQKEQAEAARDAKPAKVITNEEIPERPAMAARAAAHKEESFEPHEAASGEKLPAEHWKSQIREQKNQIANLQREIDNVNDSVRFASGNCANGRCVEWNERQREKQERVERMKAQLDEAKKHLDDMQEAARKQGYGSSVYDP